LTQKQSEAYSILLNKLTQSLLMKAKHITLLFFTLLFSIFELKAQQDSGRIYFQQAFDELTTMLDGKQPLNYEHAVFITENAYRENSIQYVDFKAALDIHENIIRQLIHANDTHNWKEFRKVAMGLPLDTDEQAKEKYRKALANWAIYTYLTDTISVNVQGFSYAHLPFTYSTADPFGTTDWKNSQVLNLLETQKGNCYALVTLFKIFSERLNTEANIVTAPQHIYIEHGDAKGDLYNVELATRSFPGTGSIETLTYITREALMNNIALRSLDLKQAIGLNLVYLAKGFENKFQTKDNEFLLACAEKTLAYDAKNLNAMLLKAQVYEQRVMKKEMPSAPYEKLLADLYTLGYRQMPDDMKNIIMAKIQGTQTPTTVTNKTPNPFESINGQARYVTLSNGLFEELHTPQKIVRYGRTVFNTELSKIVKFLDKDTSSYQVDPVVFALSVDPLTASYPWYTPYQFAGNKPIEAIDIDGLEEYHYVLTLNKQGETKVALVGKTDIIDYSFSTAWPFIKRNINQTESHTVSYSFPDYDVTDVMAIPVTRTISKTYRKKEDAYSATPEELAPSEWTQFRRSFTQGFVGGLYAKTRASLRGSGPVPGVIEISEEAKSTKQFLNWNSKTGVEFVFDSENKRFAMGKAQIGTGSPHQKLAQAIGSTNSKNVVGGTVSKVDGKFIFTENSGHYGENWTPDIRKEFSVFIKQLTGVEVNNIGYTKNK